MQINVGEDEEKLLKYEHVILDRHDTENSSDNDNQNWFMCRLSRVFFITKTITLWSSTIRNGHLVNNYAP
jgi:hypothetical protein